MKSVGSGRGGGSIYGTPPPGNIYIYIYLHRLAYVYVHTHTTEAGTAFPQEGTPGPSSPVCCPYALSDHRPQIFLYPLN